MANIKIIKNYRITKRERKESIIQFKEICIIKPNNEEKKEIRDVLAETKKLKLNLTKTKDMTSNWLRFFQLLTEDATRIGKEVTLYNVNGYLIKNIDNMGLNEVLKIK